MRQRDDGFFHYSRFKKGTGEIIAMHQSTSLEQVLVQVDDEHGVIEGHWDPETYRVEDGKVVTKWS